MSDCRITQRVFEYPPKRGTYNVVWLLHGCWAMSTFSHVGSRSSSVCVCVCVCVGMCVCVGGGGGYVCVCYVCVDGMNLKYALRWHIHISVHSVLKHTLTRILKPFEDSEPTGLKVDIAGCCHVKLLTSRRTFCARHTTLHVFVLSQKRD